ncbi:type I restriction enzyme M protein [Malaciobacter marinus]|uniref:site-specific DNA-methyltransferase (adenine-specific) n=1 Tax=Malaciobacter marinus TaxID=505249 RepID=A0AB36ZZ25_9BACT|nr:N-6 DNA methylase [Malaciobacter marinus]PPK62820.1 type I restriction enzyme M protein [Malaciobacter marinus]
MITMKNEEHMVNELYKLLDNLRGRVDAQEALEFIYILKAWEKLSNEKKIHEEISFDNFYNQKVEVKKLTVIFEKLSKTIKLFELYRFDAKLVDDQLLTTILSFVKNVSKLPNVNDMFYLDKGKADGFSVSNQIAELGVKLLDGESKELYVPFTNGFAYSYYTDKKIYADFQMSQALIISELINILDNCNIEFCLTDALKNPMFINPNAPHLLKQFDSVLSFPPFRMKGKLDTDNDKFHRFKIHKGTVLDVAHFEHILAQTSSKAVVLMATGFTFSGGVEEAFRKYLIEQNYLEAIIQLPPNLHSATSIETVFFVVNKQKSDDRVHFINLKDDSFIKRDGRRLILKDLDVILDIYENKKEIENISIIASNEEIINNNYSLAIDRYVIPQEAKELQKSLEKYELIQLEDIADIRRSQLFKDEEEGKEVYEISPSDFSKAGFTLECGKLKQIGSQYKRLQTYKLEPYDVLLSTKGTIGKVCIMGEINEAIIASQAIQVIRVQGNDKKEKAISLYMFLKSDLGQTILASLVAGTAMPQISTAEIKKLSIPLLSKEQEKRLISSFKDESKMYNEIEKINENIRSIHSNFLGEK